MSQLRLTKIKSLGKLNRSKLLKLSGYRNINVAIESYNVTNVHFKKVRKYTDKVKDDDILKRMQNDYNNIIDKLKNQEKKSIKTENKNKKEVKKFM